MKTTIKLFNWFYYPGVLANFLGKVCSGENELSEIDRSLDFLGFGGPSFVSDLSETNIKVEPEHYGYFETEPDPDFEADDYVGSNDRNDDDDEDQKGDPDFYSGSDKTR